MEYWNYIIENFLVLAVFFAGYELFLKNSKFFKFSRFYLLFGIIISLLLPLFQYTILIELQPTEFLELGKYNTEEFQQNLSNISSRDSINIETIIISIYLLISFGFFGRFLFQAFQLKRLIDAAENISVIKGVKIKQAPENQRSFSFFNYIFLNKTSEKSTKSYVLRHELIHAKQFHSLDVIFVNLVQCFLWFNPLIYFLKTRITDNLEFITDDEVTKNTRALDQKNELKNYQYQLLSSGLSPHQKMPILSFNHSSIKKRIIMLNKKASSKLHLLKLSFLIPCLSVIFYSCNVDEVEKLDENAEFSFYFNRDTSEKELQSKVSMFNHFYKDSVTLKISDVSYLNGKLNEFTISRKFPGDTGFVQSLSMENQSKKTEFANYISFKDQKLILKMDPSHKIEISKDTNAAFIRTKN